MGKVSFVMRYTSFVAGCMIMLGIGAGYAFAAFSQKLAAMLNYNQSQINLVPSLGGLGLYFGAIINGLMMDYGGATITSFVGGVCLAGGWVLFYFGSLKQIAHTPFLMGIFYAIQQFGAQGMFYAAFVGNVQNFKLKNRGTVVGVQVSMYGLSALIISQLYYNVYKEPPQLFIFMALLSFALGVLGALTIRLVKPYSTKTRLHERLLSVNAAISGTEDPPFSDEGEYDGLPARTTTESAKDSAITAPPPQPVNIPRYGELRFLTLFKSIDFWIICAISFLVAGSGATFINIVGSVAQSWKLPIEASIFTTVLSACNCAGRLIYGISNDVFHKRVRSVTYMIPISIGILVPHLIMIFWRSTAGLMIGVILTGLSYGGFFATVNVIIGRYFGDKNYSSNLGFKTLVISIASLVMGQVSGAIYDHYANKATKICYGDLCYRYTFIITSALCLGGLLCSVFLVFRERRDDKRKEAQDW